MHEQHLELGARARGSSRMPALRLAAIARIVTAMGLQEELIAALDADRVVTGDDERRRHGTDEGWHSPAAPDFVVYPRDTEEAAAVVRICRGARHADRAVRRGHAASRATSRRSRAACRST